MSKETRRAAKRQRILDAALGAFAEKGFGGSAMDDIARRAGVSKPTLYQYVGGKAALLEAVLERGARELLEPFADSDEAPLVDALLQFARHYAAFVLRPDMLALARVVIAEAQRQPGLGMRYQALGPEAAERGTADWLARRAERGELQIDNPRIAAEQLWSLLLSHVRNRALHVPEERVDPEQIEQQLRAGLGVFLKAYSTRVDEDLRRLHDHGQPIPTSL